MKKSNVISVLVLVLVFVALYFAREKGLESGDVRLYVRHHVKDYAIWKKGYDGFAAQRGDVFYQAVFQSASDANDVTVIHDFHSLPAAEAFANLPALKESMEKIGVEGAPTIWYTKLGAK